MKNLKLAVMAGILASCVGSSVYADSFQMSGEVSAINTLTFTATDLSFSDPLVAGDHALATMEIDNNDPEGFTISISSEKASNLVRYHDTNGYYSEGTAGNAVGYTMTFTAGSGTLGATDSDTLAGVAQTLPVTGSESVFTFDNVTEATVDKQYAVKLTVANPTHLLNSSQTGDTYRDTITITIANI